MNQQSTALQNNQDESSVQESLLEEIVSATRLKPADEAYSITRKGVRRQL